MQAFMIFHLMTMTLALRNDKHKRLHIPTIQQFDIVVDNTNAANPSYTVYSYSNEPPLHTYNTDESTYTDSLFDEDFLKDTADNNNCTDCKKKNEYKEEIIDENINALSPPKIIKECFNKHKIPYGEIVYSVYEKPLDLISRDSINESKNDSCDLGFNKAERITEDGKISYGEIIYAADQETTDLVSQVYTGNNKTQENEKLEINMNPLINNDLDTDINKKWDNIKDMVRANKENGSRKEEIKNKEDKENSASLFNIVGVVVLIVLNM